MGGGRKFSKVTFPLTQDEKIEISTKIEFLVGDMRRGSGGREKRSQGSPETISGLYGSAQAPLKKKSTPAICVFFPHWGTSENPEIRVFLFLRAEGLSEACKKFTGRS